MGLEKEHNYIQGHVDTIIKTVEGKKLEERVIELTEKNVPTNPSKWSYYKSQAKRSLMCIHQHMQTHGQKLKQYKVRWWLENYKRKHRRKKNLSEP